MKYATIGLSIRRAIVAISAAALLAVPTTVASAVTPTLGTFFVDDNCTPPGTGTSLDPYCTIQQAVDSAAAGSMILVRAGTYPESVTVDKRLTIMGPQSGPVATVNSFNVAANSVTLRYFTITPPTGAGVTTSPLFSGYTVFNNTITGGDEGVSYASSGLLPSSISRNTISNGAAGFGVLGVGAMSNTTIDYNSFSGLSNNSVQSLLPTNRLTIQFNTSTGVRTPFSLGAITNLTLRYNTSSAFVPGGSGIFIQGGINGGNISYNTITGPASFHGIDLNGVTGVNTGMRITFNTVKNMGGHGIAAAPNSLASGSAIEFNTAESNGFNINGDGILILTPGNTGLTLRFNHAKLNTETDMRDYTTGSGTAGTANTWLFNFCNNSIPAGLCAFPNP